MTCEKKVWRLARGRGDSQVVSIDARGSDQLSNVSQVWVPLDFGRLQERS